MVKHLPVAALVFIGVTSVGLAIWIFLEIAAASSGDLSEEARRWVLQIKTAAASAYLGFFVATTLKFCFDYVRDELQARRSRKLLATELLAELRYVGSQLVIIEAWLKYLEDAERLAENPRFTERYQLPPTPVFDASIGKLGGLGATTASTAIEVFSIIRNFKEEKDRPRHGFMRDGSDAGDLRDLFFDLRAAARVLSASIAKLDRLLAETANVRPESEGERKERVYPQNRGTRGTL